MLRSERFLNEYSNPPTRFLSVDGTAAGAVQATQLVRCSVLAASSIERYLTDTHGVTAPLGVHNASAIPIADFLRKSDTQYITDVLCSEDNQLQDWHDDMVRSFVVPTGQDRTVAALLRQRSMR